MRTRSTIAALLATAIASAHLPAGAAPDQNLGTAIMSASVSATCSLSRAAGATNAKQIEDGICEVSFDRRTDDCAYSATIGGSTPDSYGFAAQIGAWPVPSTRGNTLRVRTENSAGTRTPLAFHLIVFCAQ